MKRLFFILVFSLFNVILYSQILIDFAQFPSWKKEGSHLSTEELLKKVKWEELKKFCDTSKGHYARSHTDNVLTIYEYSEQGLVSSFRITSYKGFILQYSSDINSSYQPSSASYFDKDLWMKYVNEMLPSLSESYKLTRDESPVILKSYYRMLGVNARDEYGWICEYATKGRAPDKRIAVAELIKDQRIDLLQKLINYPNPQTQLYAIDALIYLDHETNNKIKTAQQKLDRQIDQLDSLKEAGADIRRMEAQEDAIDMSKSFINYLQGHLMSEKDWKFIFNFRDSKKTIRTCGTNGSYKVYPTPISELLSDKAISEIKSKYAELKNMGYL